MSACRSYENIYSAIVTRGWQDQTSSLQSKLAFLLRPLVFFIRLIYIAPFSLPCQYLKIVNLYLKYIILNDNVSVAVLSSVSKFNLILNNVFGPVHIFQLSSERQPTCQATTLSLTPYSPTNWWFYAHFKGGFQNLYAFPHIKNEYPQGSLPLQPGIPSNDIVTTWN